MKYTLLLYFIFLSNIGFSQIQLKGDVIDEESKSPLAYASIIIKNTNIGVLSDGDGSYELNIPNDYSKDSLVINFIGYQPRTIAIEDIEPIIYLTNAGNTIEEVVVTPIDADSILQAASKAFTSNHFRKLQKQDGFIRITVTNENDIFQIAETSYVVYYKEDEEASKRIINPLQSRMIVDSAIYKEMNEVFNFKKDEFLFEPTTFININQGFTRASQGDEKESKENTKYNSVAEYMGKSDYQGREVYEISEDNYRKKTKLFELSYLIDKESLAYSSINYESTNEEDLKKIIPFAVRTLIGVLGYKFYINKISGRVYHRYNGEFFELDKGVFYLSGGISKGGEWIKGSLLQEFYLQDSYAVESIPELDDEDNFITETVTTFEQDYFTGFHLPTTTKTKEQVAQINKNNQDFSGNIYSDRHKKWLKKQENKKKRKKKKKN